MESGELLFGASADPGQVFATLSARYQVHAEPTTIAHWTCVDTADWRLHRAGLTLRDARQGRASQLLLSVRDSPPITAPSPRKRWPRRVDTLPASLVRERIAPAVGVRALLPLAEVDVRSLVLRLLDNDEKTRVRVQVDQQRLTGTGRAPLPLRVLVSPLRGYERDGRRCAEMLTDSMRPVSTGLTAATVAMSMAGHAPGQPAVAPPDLDPAASAVESLVRVLRRWMDVVDLARPGVLADIDVEYLHDLRTAVRATRSMLTLAGDLLPASQTARFAAEFAWLSRLTTPVRDLDVSLLELDGQGDTDVTGLDDLEPMRRHLAARRSSALRALRTGLQSARGAGLGISWRRALDDVAAAQLPAPATSDRAATQARTAYARTVKAAARVTGETPADELHRLRRRCKQMRYLLDSYGSIFAPDPHRDVLRTLKSLQDCLGAIQDVDVQRGQLSAVATALTRRGTSAETVLAMGALGDRTARRETAARRVLARRLERFCAPATRECVDVLAPSR